MTRLTVAPSWSASLEPALIDKAAGSTFPAHASTRRFEVPFVHRLYFTQDIFGCERTVLAELLEPSADRLPKVQVWIDDQVAAALPKLIDTVARFLDEQGERLRPAGVETIPGGEVVKNDWKYVERLLQAIHDADLDRRSYLVAVGGGAVLDAVGFAAATAHRGIRLVRLPTTTLAQADSGVGVKNAVNKFGKKNWLGTFAVPWAIINDSGLLAGLPDRAFVAGFSEAVKVALLKSPEEFARLRRHASRIKARDLSVALPAIRASAELHRAHITQGGDPFEALEARPLDFGHWSAHRMEALSHFELPHGEAVAIGVAIDTLYSSMVHGLPESSAAAVVETLRALGLPLDHPTLRDPHALFEGLEEFRQHLGGRLTLTMLRDVGDPIEVHEIDKTAMRAAIEKVSRGLI